MALYRYQAVSVGLWRGKIKRWNTTFHSTNSNIVQGIRNMIQAMCWPNPGDVGGACSGGLASITTYNASGGQPIAQSIYFDWQTPSTWQPFTGTAWSGVDPNTPLDAAGESALVIGGRLPGLSSTGKPMYIRKYLHAVPSRTSLNFDDPDVPAADVTSLKSAIYALAMYSPSGTTPSTFTVDEWYGNHQRVRGRRRTTKQVAGQAFSLGVLAGGGATTSGQGDQFPGGEF